MHLLAAAPDDVRPAILFAWLAGSAVAILVGSLVQAPLLLVACWLARLPGVRFGEAWGAVLVCNVVFYGFLAVIAFGTMIGISMDGGQPLPGTYRFLLSPVNFIYLFVAGAVGHALVFSPRLAEPDEPAIGFGRATGVAVVYLGLCAMAASIVFVGYTLATASLPK
jgi:hypothetical protein